MPLLDFLVKKEDKSCIGFFVGCTDHFHVTLIDAETEQPLGGVKYFGKNLKSVVKDIPATFGTKLKAVFIDIFEFYGHSYKRNIDLCFALRSKFNSINVPHAFVTHVSTIFGSLILEANISLNFGDTIVCAQICGKPNPTVMDFGEIGYEILFVEMEFTEMGYEETENVRIKIDGCAPSEAENDAIQDMINNYCRKHKFVIFQKYAENPFITPLTKMLKMKNVIFVNPNIPKYLVEATKWLMDKSYTKFYVIPKCLKEYIIVDVAARLILSINPDDSLPCTQATIVGRSDTTFLQHERYSEKPNNVIHKMPQKCHRNKITFSVDAEGFTKYRAEPILLPQIQFWPGFLNDTVKSKIPMIGFCDNFSVICTYNTDENRYKFLDGWNGIYGNELVINFCDKKLLYCEKALAASNYTIRYDFDQKQKLFQFQDSKKPIYGMSKKKPHSPFDEFGEQYVPGTLVYDLIRIMSMPVDDIKLEDSWCFRITKDESNPVILEFMNHENLLKRASPAFLMALLLKNHLKVIKNEIGEKPEKIGFCILDEGYGSEEKERIKNGLEEACDLIKIDHVFFGF